MDFYLKECLLWSLLVAANLRSTETNERMSCIFEGMSEKDPNLLMESVNWRKNVVHGDKMIAHAVFSRAYYKAEQ